MRVYLYIYYILWCYYIIAEHEKKRDGDGVGGGVGKLVRGRARVRNQRRRVNEGWADGGARNATARTRRTLLTYIECYFGARSAATRCRPHGRRRAAAASVACRQRRRRRLDFPPRARRADANHYQHAHAEPADFARLLARACVPADAIVVVVVVAVRQCTHTTTTRTAASENQKIFPRPHQRRFTSVFTPRTIFSILGVGTSP